MGIARHVRRLIPDRWEPPARYAYERFRGLLERELPVAAGVVRPGDRVIDVGANVGIYSHVFAKRGARVEAFEPQAACAAMLRAYAAGRHVSVHQVALGATYGHATLHIPHENGRRLAASASLYPGEAGSREEVDVTTLDQFEFDGVSLIKIDVEGAELDVVAGGLETLRRNRPQLLVEIEQRHHPEPIERVFARFESLGYDAYFLDAAGVMRPVAEFDLKRDQALGPGHVYVNNFLFEHREGDRRWPRG